MAFPEVRLDDLVPFLCHSPYGTIVRCCCCYVKKAYCGFLVAPPFGKPFVCHMYYDLYFSVSMHDYTNSLFHPDLFPGVKI